MNRNPFPTRRPAISGPAEAAPLPRSIGTHLLADLHGVAPALLTDEQALMDLLTGSLRAAGFQILGQMSRKFPGAESGVTGVVLLTESHAALHTWPEHGYLALDLFTCGAPDPDDVLAAVVQSLGPQEVRTVRQSRGGSEAVRQVFVAILD